MQFELLTLSGVRFSGQIDELSIHAADGAVTILPHHENFTSLVKPGVAVVRSSKKQESFVIFDGILDITDNGVKLLVDEAEHEDELVESEIAAALKKAEALKTAAKDKHELHRAQQLVDRHNVRLDVARVKRKIRQR
jgi:F-type H+-transporting ATPase subunit epsilon